jgi:hypothetical protein
MRDIYGESLGNSLTIDAKKITPQNLINAYEEAISHPIEKNRIAEIKKLSMNNFSIAKEIANQ